MENFGFLNAYRYAPQNFMRDLDITWDRPHPGPFIWGRVEKIKGIYDWSYTDEYVKKAQDFNLSILATIWPFAEWDQRIKSGNEQRVFEKDTEGKPLLGYGREKPTDMEAYGTFVTALVDRYNGDGINDMPNLKYPIKYWEASNEPSFQQPRLVFFDGSPDEYFQLLKVTYKAIKSVDKDAKVLNGGMAHMMRNASPRGKIGTVEFWERVLSLGGGKYFDIGNIHSIGVSNNFFVPDYSNFLKEHGIEKEIWVTEAYLRVIGTNLFDERSLEDHASDILKGYVVAFANGAKKIFYTHLSSDKNTSEEFQRCALIYENENRPAYYAMKTMAKKIGNFDNVKKIKDNIYEFTIGTKKEYVVWGKENLKNLLGKKFKITDLYGKEKEVNTADYNVTESPVFVEII